MGISKRLASQSLEDPPQTVTSRCSDRIVTSSSGKESSSSPLSSFSSIHPIPSQINYESLSPDISPSFSLTPSPSIQTKLSLRMSSAARVNFNHREESAIQSPSSSPGVSGSSTSTRVSLPSVQTHRTGRPSHSQRPSPRQGNLTDPSDTQSPPSFTLIPQAQSQSFDIDEMDEMDSGPPPSPAHSTQDSSEEEDNIHTQLRNHLTPSPDLAFLESSTLGDIIGFGRRRSSSGSAPGSSVSLSPRFEFGRGRMGIIEEGDSGMSTFLSWVH